MLDLIVSFPDHCLCFLLNTQCLFFYVFTLGHSLSFACPYQALGLNNIY